jgi:indolepyruvate ferredoxin oxidoreductase beta subunit
MAKASVPDRAPKVMVAAGSFEIDVRHDWCKVCDICSRVCPEYCLEIDPGVSLRVVDAAACTGCRLCELLCPDFAISIRASTTEPVAAGAGSS